MAISKADWELMKKVAAYFEATKMLITMGVFSTPMSKEAQKLRQSGMSIQDIASELGVSVGTVSSNLSYEFACLLGNNYLDKVLKAWICS